MQDKAASVDYTIDLYGVYKIYDYTRLLLKSLKVVQSTRLVGIIAREIIINRQVSCLILEFVEVSREASRVQ